MSQIYTREEWLELVKTWETSGQTQASYCQDKGIKKVTFTRWRSKFIASGEVQSFAPVKADDGNVLTHKSSLGSFIPFDVVSSKHSAAGDMIELILPHGIIIKVPVDVSPSR